MGYLYWFLSIVLSIILFIRSKNRRAGPGPGGGDPIVIDPEDSEPVDYDYTTSYQKKQLLTDEEKGAYLGIKEAADRLGMHLLTKMRLSDLLEPSRDDEHFRGAEWVFRSELIDFVVCDGSLTPMAVIELETVDWRQPERGKLVDAALQAAGYKVIRLSRVDPDELTERLRE